MKSISTLLCLVLISCVGIKAQKPILVSVDSLKFGKGMLPSLTVTIPEVNLEKTLKAWTKELQSGTKSKLLTENGEMSIFGAKIGKISPNPINVYSKMVNLDSVVKLTAAFEMKKDQYIDISTGEPGLTNAKSFLKEFAKEQYIELAKDQADAEDKKLYDFQKDLSSLEKEKTKLQKSIQSNNSDIITEKDNITVQNNELSAVSAEIIEQNKQLITMEEGNVKKEKMNYINGLEKRKKKALNSIESSQNKINKANSEIDKANLDISTNAGMQIQANEKVVKQQAVYQTFADKLKTIKSY